MIRKEMDVITQAMLKGEAVYTLQFFTDIKISAFGTASRK